MLTTAISKEVGFSTLTSGLARHPSTMAASIVIGLPTRTLTPLPLALSLETLLR